MDRLNRRLDPLNRAETFSYDTLGNLVSTVDRKLQASTFEYDPLNRRVRSTFADGTTFAYDAAGRMTLADDTADPHRPIVMTYDPLDRLLSETSILGAVTYQYDALGRRTQMTVAGQAPVAYAYDRNSRLRTIVQEPLSPVALQYDAAGRQTLLTLSNGVSTEYQYNPSSRLTALTYSSGAGLLGELTYAYDPAGNRTGVGGSFARTLLPDPVASATYDAANQQLAFSDKTMAFDPNGNVATLTDSTGNTTFGWDSRNRLVGFSSPGVTASFAYDAFGRRVAKEVNGQRIRHLYDGSDIMQEVTQEGEVPYLRTLVTDEPLVRNREEFYLSDALGSSIALIDPSGTLTTRYAYDPFGHSSAEGTVSGNPFQYTGREHDGTGLYFYRARYYHPTIARFLQEDPIGLASGSPNLYLYTFNNPVNLARAALPGRQSTAVGGSCGPERRRAA